MAQDFLGDLECVRITAILWLHLFFQTEPLSKVKAK